MTRRKNRPVNPDCGPLMTELLILPDGRILVHNLTRPFASLLHELNPKDVPIAARAGRISKRAFPGQMP